MLCVRMSFCDRCIRIHYITKRKYITVKAEFSIETIILGNKSVIPNLNAYIHFFKHTAY